MQLKLQRSQRGAAISGKVIFCLDARAYLTAEEQANVNKYRLGSQVIYNSEASKKQLDAAAKHQAEGSYFKGLGRLALVAMNLNITINSLQRGQHIECKDMNELLSAEEELMEACEKLKSFLEAAATFDGREVVIDYSGSEPQVIAPATTIPSAPSSAPVPDPVVASMPPLPPADIVPQAGALLLPPASPAAGTATAVFDTSRVTTEQPPQLTRAFSRVSQWWRSQPTRTRIIYASGALIAVGTLLNGGSGFFIGALLAAAYFAYEVIAART